MTVHNLLMCSTITLVEPSVIALSDYRLVKNLHRRAETVRQSGSPLGSCPRLAKSIFRMPPARGESSPLPRAASGGAARVPRAARAGYKLSKAQAASGTPSLQPRTSPPAGAGVVHWVARVAAQVAAVCACPTVAADRAVGRCRQLPPSAARGEAEPPCLPPRGICVRLQVRLHWLAVAVVKVSRCVRSCFPRRCQRHARVHLRVRSSTATLCLRLGLL